MLTLQLRFPKWWQQHDGWPGQDTWGSRGEGFTRWAFGSTHVGKVMGNREETALAGRWWFRMGPPPRERQILDWKAGRCPLTGHLNTPRYVHFWCPKSFCEFLIDSNYFKCKSINFFKSYSNKAILSFLSECNTHTVKDKNLMSPWIRFHKINTFPKQPQIRNSTAIEVLPCGPYTSSQG